MDIADITKRMRREREFWVEVGPGKRLKLLRPFVTDTGVIYIDGKFSLDATCELCLVGWDGIVESDLFASGGAEPVDYSHALASAALRDNFAWGFAVAKGIDAALGARMKATAEAEKNSEPT